MNADLTRRPVLFTLLALLAGGCGSSPPRRWHRLALDVPGPAGQPSAGPGAPMVQRAAAAGQPALWEVVPRVAVPAYLEREELQFDAGNGRVELLGLERWAEPLADAVPRLLLHDLARLRGAALVWPAPAPLELGARRRLRVQLLALQAEPAAGRLRLQAAWTLQGADAAPQQGRAALQVPLPDATPAALVAAHRLALWELAREIAAAAP